MYSCVNELCEVLPGGVPGKPGIGRAGVGQVRIVVSQTRLSIEKSKRVGDRIRRGCKHVRVFVENEFARRRGRQQRGAAPVLAKGGVIGNDLGMTRGGMFERAEPPAFAHGRGQPDVTAVIEGIQRFVGKGCAGGLCVGVEGSIRGRAGAARD